MIDERRGADRTGEACQVVLRDEATGLWRAFSGLRRIVSTSSIGEVRDCLREVEDLVGKRGWTAAGMVAYEAAPAFDEVLRVKKDNDFPLFWFGLYQTSGLVSLPRPEGSAAELPWKATVNEAGYRRCIRQVQDYIRAGDTYQVNYTYRLKAMAKADPWQLFLHLAAGHDPPYGGFLQIPGWTILSLSPECFFRLNGDRIVSEPMKGTIGRGLTPAEDTDQGERLRTSLKDRAENVMIVDMVRNDLARIAWPGTVRTSDLFAVERYPTLWQMISRVEARTTASLDQIFAALFPAASITGAPKARTMAIIAELETTPRRLYTGTIGFLLPGRQAQFNVAIRTLLIKSGDGNTEYGVGGGITADSTATGEWEETRLKSLACIPRIADFSLLESLLWTPVDGYAFLAEHLARLTASADYFSYPCRLEEVESHLAAAAADFGESAWRVRLLLDREGRVRLEATPFIPPDRTRPFRLTLAPYPIDEKDLFLYHKTTRRGHYERMRKNLPPGFDDVVLYNQRGEVTETTIANIVVTIDGRDWTPPVRCGLLAGTHRQHLLAAGLVEERVVSVEELVAIGRFELINAVRGRYPALFDPGTGHRS